LDKQKAKVGKALSTLDKPIVVLIDELDRVEEAEIKIMAQVVRSIADFPQIAYVLAYDEQRVLQALGNGHEERGRSYLEKIVQLQFPLPITLDTELTNLLNAEIAGIQQELGLPVSFVALERYT